MNCFSTLSLASLIIASGWVVAADDSVNPFVQTSFQEDESADVVPDPAAEHGSVCCEQNSSEGCKDDCYQKGGGKGCASDGCYRPLWSVEADFLALRRDHMDNVALFVDPAGAVLLDADDMNLDTEAGVKVALARQINACNDIEFEFFFVDDWTAAVTEGNPVAQVAGWFGGVPFGTSPLHLTYDSSLYNTELNWRRSWFCDRVKTIVGFRWIELSEDMQVIDAGSPPPLSVGDVNNHLYGVQVGFEAVALKLCRLEIEIGLKAGVYHNTADGDVGFPQAAQSFRAESTSTAFTGELMLGGSYRLTDCLSIRAGYQVMWIEGVAILPEQLDDPTFVTSGVLDMNGSPVYHGAYVGLDLTF